MSETSKKPHRVLVVDDNQDAASSLAIVLEQAGFRVETAFNGRAAMDVLQRFDPEICILDINMPGLNGYDLARRIREMAPDHAPLLATVTAYSDTEHLDRAVAAGFDLHFTKPADPCEMVDQLEDYLSRDHST